MTTNPLARRREEPANDWAQRPVARTSRPYVEDLRDAYNAAMSAEARQRGLEWFVTPTGELKLGDNLAWSKHNAAKEERRRESERAGFVRRQNEARG